MRVLIGCEYSGIVRDAFLRLGHYAMSCDLLPSEGARGLPHYQGDVRDVLHEGWDLAIFHPPCTYSALSGVRWLSHPADSGLPFAMRREHPRHPGRRAAMRAGADFFRSLLNAPIPRIAVENPVIHGYAAAIIGRGHDQTVQPWQFGQGETKRVCLWLKNLPPLEPTRIVAGREERVWRMAPGPERQKERSRFFTGIAAAMAAQWGDAL